jgi:hypothetical protein
MRSIKLAVTAGLLSTLLVTNAHALTVNGALAIIDRVVAVQMTQTDDGTNFATLFGNAFQEEEILGFIDEIWAQEGIDVNFLGATTYSNTLAYEGVPGMISPRPGSDLGDIEDNGVLHGVSNASPLVLYMYFVNIVPGFSLLDANRANGLAFRPGKTSAVGVGVNLLDVVGAENSLLALSRTTLDIISVSRILGKPRTSYVALAHHAQEPRLANN